MQFSFYGTFVFVSSFNGLFTTKFLVHREIFYFLSQYSYYIGLCQLRVFFTKDGKIQYRRHSWLLRYGKPFIANVLNNILIVIDSNSEKYAFNPEKIDSFFRHAALMTLLKVMNFPIFWQSSTIAGYSWSFSVIDPILEKSFTRNSPGPRFGIQ